MATDKVETITKFVKENYSPDGKLKFKIFNMIEDGIKMLYICIPVFNTTAEYFHFLSEIDKILLPQVDGCYESYKLIINDYNIYELRKMVCDMMKIYYDLIIEILSYHVKHIIKINKSLIDGLDGMTINESDALWFSKSISDEEMYQNPNLCNSMLNSLLEKHRANLKQR